jgi:membrane protease subunit HflK
VQQVLSENRKVVGGDGRQLIYVPMGQGATTAATSSVPNVLPADLVAPTITATPTDPRADRGERVDERAEVTR